MTLKGLWPASKLRPNGRPYWYVRRKGLPNVPLPDLPHDHPAFLAAYAAAWDIPAPRRAAAEPDGGLARVIGDASGSARFRQLSPAYRAGLRREWSAMC